MEFPKDTDFNFEKYKLNEFDVTKKITKKGGNLDDWTKARIVFVGFRGEGEGTEKDRVVEGVVALEPVVIHRVEGQGFGSHGGTTVFLAEGMKKSDYGVWLDEFDIITEG